MQTSIAAALFDIPTVWGWAAPGKPMPDTWRVIFDEKHVDGKVYSKVFSSCRTGREWVLRNAPSAQLHLNTVSPMHPRAWFGRLTRAAAALDTRGGLTTRMKVTCDDSAESAAACGLMPSVLAGHTAGVTHLVVSDVSAQRPCEFSVALLRVVLLPFPNLTSLTLSPCPPTIPSRDHLKGLKQLSLSADVLIDSILTSCAPLLQQLTSLTLRGGEAAQRPQWPLLFNAASTTSTLTSFTTDHSLTDTLMDLLMQHAPALGQLTVHALRMGVDYSARHWSVRELRAGMGRPHCILWFQLMALPSGKRSLISDGRLALYVEGAEGLSAASIERLTEWTFVLKEVSVLHGNLPTADHPAALRAALGQLHDGLRVVKRGHDSSRGPGEGQGGSGAGVVAADNQCTVRLCDWPWTPELLRTVAPYYVAYAEKQLKLRLTEIPTLTDELLSAAIEVAPLMPVLRAEKIALQSDQHAAAAWPWDTLGIEVADALQLLMLPAPSGPGALRSLVLQQLTIPSVIPQATVERLTAWFKHTKLAQSNEDDPRRMTQGLCIYLEAPNNSTAQLATLRAQLTVLRAMQFGRNITGHPPTQRVVTVQLRGYSMTLPLIRALEGLPEWESHLDLSQCQWPLKHTEYKSLAQHVPTSYQGWVVPGRPRSPLLESIAAGQRTPSASGRAPHVALLLPDYTGAPMKRGQLLLVSALAKRSLWEHGVRKCWVHPDLCSV